MVRLTVCLQLLLFVLIPKQSDVVSAQCSELEDEKIRLDKDINNTQLLKHNKWEEAGQCEVSGYYIDKTF